MLKVKKGSLSKSNHQFHFDAFIDSGGALKILDACQLPLTAKNCVNLIITEKVQFQVITQNTDVILCSFHSLLRLFLKWITNQVLP